jgi:hypothetical protein
MAQLITPDYNKLVPNFSLFGTGFQQGQQISESMANRQALNQQAQEASQLAGTQSRAQAGDKQALQDVAGTAFGADLQAYNAATTEAERAEDLRENEELTRTSLNALSIDDPIERRLFLERKRAGYIKDGRDTSNINGALKLDDAALGKELTMQAQQGQSIADQFERQFPSAETKETMQKTRKIESEIRSLEKEILAEDKPDLKQKFDMETKLNEKYTTRTKDFTASKSDYQKMKDSAKEDTGPGDVALIFSFMKMLDPGSVVRESEFAIAQNSGGLLESLVVSYAKAKDGDRLTSGQRNNFLVLAKKYMSASSEHEALVRGDLQNMVKDYKLSAKNVFGNAQAREDLTKSVEGEDSPPIQNRVSVDF